MLLRRVIEHLKDQNWFAVALDLVVVVVGIFLAFQVERWYSEQLLQSSQVDHLEALAVDLEASRLSLQRDIGLHQDAIKASLALLTASPDAETRMTGEEFYDLMRRVQYMGNWSPQSRAYDVLVSSGQIDVIEDDKLKSDLASYYALAARAETRRNEMILQRVMIFEPYINRNLDHTAMVMKVHPNISETITSSLPSNQFLQVLGTQEFEGVITTKMHGSYDASAYLGRLLGLNLQIERTLARHLKQ